MKAIVVRRSDVGQSVQLEPNFDSELMDGDVTVKITHSTVNYKDGLAITGKVPVLRKFPMIPGIDFAGVVESSSHADFKPGDPVVLNGWGIGEAHFGGYAEKARVNGDWLVPMPDGLSAREAMSIGTAGYTAMLSVMALEKSGAKPTDGPALVTGAAGGVGSVSIVLLSDLGWRVIASTGRREESAFLKELGADEIIDRSELAQPGKPLGRERWVAAVDSVGSTTLANVLSMTKYGGAVAACGLAGGMDLPATVAPFILRGVSLLGIDSVMAPKAKRIKAWQRLAAKLDRAKLDKLTSTIGMESVIATARDIIDGKVRGRVVVEVA